jgi:hypothetical protein
MELLYQPLLLVSGAGTTVVIIGSWVQYAMLFPLFVIMLWKVIVII